MGNNCAQRHDTAGQILAADPVNTATGNFHETFADFTIPGRGPSLALSHSYNSLQARNDAPLPSSRFPLGYGWTHAYGMSLVLDDVAILEYGHRDAGEWGAGDVL